MISQNMNMTIDVVGGDEAVHRAGEGEQQRGEATEAGLGRREVAGAVEQHEGADAGDDEGEQPGERVDPERERDAQLRDPLDRLDDRTAGRDRARLEERPDECRRGHTRDDVEDLRRQHSSECGRGDGDRSKNKQDCRHAGLPGGGGLWTPRLAARRYPSDPRNDDRPPPKRGPVVDSAACDNDRWWRWGELNPRPLL